MALPTTMQYSESNLIGYLNTGITASGTTITVRFYDKITGEVRTPLSTTLLFVIDKGSEVAPNRNYEIVLATAHTTTDGVTTMTGCVRGLPMSGSALSAGTGKAHPGEAEVGCVDVHFNWTTIIATLKGVGDTTIAPTFASLAALGTDVPSPTNGQNVYVTGLGFLSRQGGAWFGTPMLIFADDASRDAAIPSPSNGMKVYNSGVGAFQGYIGGTWTNEGSSTTPNATEVVIGKVRLDVAAAVTADPVVPGLNSPRILGSNSASTANTLSLGSVVPANQATAFNMIADATYTAGGYRVTRDGTSGGANANTVVTHRGTGELKFTNTESGNFYINTVAGIFKHDGDPCRVATAGETITAGQPVYWKTDGKVWLAVNSAIASADAMGIAATSGAADATIWVQQGGIVAGTYTAGSYYYVSGTPGALTATHPAMDNSAIVPMLVGYCVQTNVLQLRPQRLQRIKGFANERTVVSGSGTQSITIGFPVASIKIDSLTRILAGIRSVSSGYADLISGNQYSANNTTQCVYHTESDGGGGTATAIASANGNNIDLAWTFTSYGAGDIIFSGQAYEKL